MDDHAVNVLLLVASILCNLLHVVLLARSWRKSRGPARGPDKPRPSPYRTSVDEEEEEAKEVAATVPPCRQKPLLCRLGLHCRKAVRYEEDLFFNVVTRCRCGATLVVRRP
jgi:hypothetical protein